jgi:fibronectin type 3 domain-containing protein
LLTWNASPEASVSGYRVYIGTASGSYQQSWGQGQPVGGATTYTVTGLETGRTYYFAVTAVDASGHESMPSVEATKLVQ